MIQVGDAEEEVEVDIEGEDREAGQRKDEEPSSSDERTEPEVRNGSAVCMDSGIVENWKWLCAS